MDDDTQFILIWLVATVLSAILFPLLFHAPLGAFVPFSIFVAVVLFMIRAESH